MEVAGRWRQHWSGAAEYGKTVDGVGGVTRMARAMEVVHTSGPGARMRVTRSAFHSAGPLSTSFLLHSSTRTILSSRGDTLLSPSLVGKPQEVSSTPLDAASDSSPDGEVPYKVTEPDDNDISEPSKWRSSLGRSSLHTHSEESSSTDNASLVDSQARVHLITVDRRTNSSKSSTASSQSAINRDEDAKPLRASFRRKPTSEPLMKIVEHARCLESSKSQNTKAMDEWHDRRNSYGFENSPLGEPKSLSENNRGVMESSTDSGICKSTEIVSSPAKAINSSSFGDSDRINKDTEDSSGNFKDWLAKNRLSSASKANYSSLGRNIQENRSLVNLKSLGKISIALPRTSESSDEDNMYNTHKTNENDRKYKKVEFCKTELHFAADSGKVNIIETDEKPPPKHDFRRRRSAFAPINNELERPITLFGGSYHGANGEAEQTHFGENDTVNTFDRTNNDPDNESSVKSILKNKIPKPKPYLLGEDIEFDKDKDSLQNIWGVRLRRTSDEYLNSNSTKSPVSILNESLKEEKWKKHLRELERSYANENEDLLKEDNSKSLRSSPVNYTDLREVRANRLEKRVASTQTSEDLFNGTVKSVETAITQALCKPYAEQSFPQNVQEKLQQLSPILQNKARTRHLRQNELSYFGVSLHENKKNNDYSSEKSLKPPEKSKKCIKHNNKPLEPSRRSSETPLYQNFPSRALSLPVPAPRSSKPERQVNENRKTTANDITVTSLNVKMEEFNVERKPSPERTKTKEVLVLNTINELQESNYRGKHIYDKTLTATPEVLQKSVDGCIGVERSRGTLKKANSKETITRSRESSVDDSGRINIENSRRIKNGSDRLHKTSKVELDSIRSGKIKSEKVAYTDLQKIGSSKSKDDTMCRTQDTKRDFSSSIDSKEAKIQRNHSADRKSHSRNGSEYSRPKNSNNTIIEEARNENMKGRSSRSSREDGARERQPRGKEYTLNYDEKNGTLSSVRKSHSRQSSKRNDKVASCTKAKIEEKPKEITRTSRVTTLQVKNPMILTKESHRRTKSADHRPKKKQEPPQ